MVVICGAAARKLLLVGAADMKYTTWKEEPQGDCSVARRIRTEFWINKLSPLPAKSGFGFADDSNIGRIQLPGLACILKQRILPVPVTLLKASKVDQLLLAEYVAYRITKNFDRFIARDASACNGDLRKILPLDSQKLN